MLSEAQKDFLPVNIEYSHSSIRNLSSYLAEVFPFDSLPLITADGAGVSGGWGTVPFQPLGNYQTKANKRNSYKKRVCTDSHAGHVAT